MDSETMTDIVTRLRHKAILYREAAEKCVEAIRVLQGPMPGEEAKRIEAGGTETATIIEEVKREAVPVRKRGQGTGLAEKIRTAVAKIGPATTREVTEWLHKHDFPATTSSTASAMLWEGRKRGEFSKDSEARWTYTGGLAR